MSKDSIYLVRTCLPSPVLMARAIRQASRRPAAAQVGRLEAVSLRHCSLRLGRATEAPDFRSWAETRSLDVSGIDGLGVGGRQLEVRCGFPARWDVDAQPSSLQQGFLTAFRRVKEASHACRKSYTTPTTTRRS